MDMDLVQARRVLGLLPVDALPSPGAPSGPQDPLTRSRAALRLARDLAPRILRGQLSVEQGALEISDLVRRCSPEEVPRELRLFESWASGGEPRRAVSSEAAQAILEWAMEMSGREPGR